MAHAPLHPTLRRVFASALFLSPVVGVLLFLAVSGIGAQDAPAPPPEPPPAAAPVELPAAPPPPAADTVQVVGTVPLPGEPLRDQIVVFFNHEMALPAGPDGAQPPAFSIEPAVEGRFRIEGNYVSFRSDGFEQGRTYEVRLNDALQSREGGAVDPARRQFSFATFVFEPIRVWALEESPSRTVLGLLYPAPVDLASLESRVTVATRDGQAVPIRIEPGTDGNTARLVIEGAVQWPVTVNVAEGVAARQGDLRQREPRTLVHPAEAELVVTVLNWSDFTNESQAATIGFSQPVLGSDLRDRLTIRRVQDGAEVPYALQGPPDEPMADQTVRMNLNLREEVKLEFAIGEGLRGSGQATLMDPYKGRLDHAEEPLRVDNTWWGRENRDGLVLNVELSNHVDLQDLKQHLSFKPEVADLRLERRYRNNFAISGVWDSKRDYELTLAPGLKFGGTGVLEEPVTRTVTSETVPSYIGFGHPGKFYFPRQGGLSLPLESRNVRKAKLSLYKLFPQNLVVALRDSNRQEQNGSGVIAWSGPAGSRDLDLQVNPDRLVETPLDLNALFPDKRGVYALRAEKIEETTPRTEEEYYWGPDSESKLVLMTDIGVLAHWRDKELVLFAHDLYSLAPLAQAKVSVYSDKNQLLGQGNTNEQGIARLGSFDPGLGVPQVAVVEQGEDFTFLELDPRPDDIKPVEADLPGYSREGYDAFIYADRELYRPGETAHLRWTVRTNYGDALKNVPLLVTVVKPNGRDLLSRPTVLSSFGTGGLDLPTQRIYPTGLYTVRLTVPGSGGAIGTYTFHLEDFVPNRMKVAVTAPAGVWVAGQPYEMQLNAQHLFGAPAADRKAEGRVSFSRGDLQLDAWKEFRFDNDSEFVPDAVQLGEARTDDAGNASFKFTYTPPMEVTFPVKASVIGRVFELGGRAVAGREERTLLPAPIALGVAAAPGAGGQGIEVFAAAVKADGAPAALGAVRVTLERESWDYYVRRYYSHYEPNWSRRFEVIETREVALADGRGSTSFSFNDYGYYRVRVHSEATPQFSTLSFYAYGGQYQLVDSARPSLVKLTADKPRYKVGEEAVVRIESPFDGQGLVVVQGEELQQMLPVTIQGGKGEVRLPIAAEQYPNVWVEVTIVHTVKTERTQVYPFSSFAMTRLDVDNPQRKLTVGMPGLPEEVRPAQPLTVTVEVRDAANNPAVAEVTVAAVDEGIHSITGYKNPAPYDWLSRPRRPDLRRAHYYDKVVYDFTKPAPGGDLDSEMGKRASAVEENWIRPLALWSGAVVTGADGRASITFDVPEFAGELRLVAVASSETALGAGAESLLVRRPYMLRTSLPRFLLPGDKAQTRAVVFNNSDAPVTATVSWSVGGAIAEGQGSQDLAVAPHKEASLLAPIAAGNAVGQGELRWSVVVTDASGKELERLAERDLLPVRPPAAFQSAHDLVVLNPGENRTFKNDKFLDDARAELELAVSASPTLRLEDALEWLVGYPYGCIEQTVSKLMPTYLLRKNEALVKTAVSDTQQLEGWIDAGISRLFSMQTQSGGFGMWPGAREPYPYGSIYALHFLTLVKNDREYDVPAESFQLLQNYVRGVAGDWNSGNAPSDLYRRAYATYVLALDGDMEAVRQIERFDALTIPTAARYLLAAALARNTRDTDRVKLYLQSAPSEPFLAIEQDNTLNSPVRNTAVKLLALRQMGADGQAMLELANELVDYLATHRHGNTQETAFVVSALAEYLAGIQTDLSGAAATVAGQGQEEAVAGAEVFEGKQTGAGAAFTVANTGNVPVYVSLTTRGVPAEPQTEPVSEGMSVVRRVLTSTGGKRPDGPLAQGQTYVVEVQVAADGELRNVVVADLLPAGLEIENPRLDPDALPGKRFKQTITPTYLDLRDDRLVAAFDEMPPGEHRFFYVVRAVTPGQYQHPPVVAECMYDARFHASSAPATAEVKGAEPATK